MKNWRTMMAMGAACLLLSVLALPIIHAQTNPVDYEPPVDGAGSYTGVAENIGYGAVDFLFVEGHTPWAAMVVNAGDPDGIDMVSLTFDEETDSLSIELTDSNSTNHATVLVNRMFAEKYIGESETDLAFELSDAVNYQGMQNNNETAEDAVYVFQVEHFSTQTIEISGASQEGIPSLGVFSVILLTGAVAVIVGIKRRY